MSVHSTRQRQLRKKINTAAEASIAINKPLGGWINAFQTAIGMRQTYLTQRLKINRNSLYKSIENEKSGSISLKQLEKVADAMGGKLVYAIVPKEGDVESIVTQQAYKKAKRIVSRTLAHMTLEEQTDGLQNEEKMIKELMAEIIATMPPYLWK